MADLTDEQWEYVEPYLRGREMPEEWAGKAEGERALLNGVLWHLRTGAGWRDLPARYPPRTTCWRRYQDWRESGTLALILKALAVHLLECSGVDVSRVETANVFPEQYGERCWVFQRARLFLSPEVQKALRREDRSSLGTREVPERGEDKGAPLAVWDKGD